MLSKLFARRREHGLSGRYVVTLDESRCCPGDSTSAASIILPLMAQGSHALHSFCDQKTACCRRRHCQVRGGETGRPGGDAATGPRRPISGGAPGACSGRALHGGKQQVMI